MVHGGQSRFSWAYAAPALALMALVNVVPIGASLWLAEGYAKILQDGRLGTVLLNTSAFTAVTVALEAVLGMVMALVLARPFPGRGWVRAFVLIPWALPSAVMAMAWRWIFNDTYGILGHLLHGARLVSDPHIPWLADPFYARAACVLADVWKTTPFMAILFLSGLATVPSELYEAAAIDGAGPWRRFWMVTLPCMKPTIALAVLFRSIQAFGVFDLIWVLTGGGPGGSTQTLALYLYDTVFRYLDLGYGAALTLLMGACLSALALVPLVFLRERKS